MSALMGRCCVPMVLRTVSDESVFQMLAQNKAMLSWCGDSWTTTARTVGGVISMLQTVDSPAVNGVCNCSCLRTLSCSYSSNSLFSLVSGQSWHGVYIVVTTGRLARGARAV